MHLKKQKRLRRSLRSRMKIRKFNVIRLSVYKSSCHISAQLISEDNQKVLCSVSTQQKIFSGERTSNVQAAEKVGKLLGEKAKELNIERIAFDRSGYQYHGRVKALAEGARSVGLVF